MLLTTRSLIVTLTKSEFDRNWKKTTLIYCKWCPKHSSSWSQKEAGWNFIWKFRYLGKTV